MRGPQLLARLAGEASLSKLHPTMMQFLKEYLENEKAVEFGGRFVINTHLPPFPSRAFDVLLDHFSGSETGARRLFSVTLAVTNRCSYNCWHCYNDGRSQEDLPLAVIERLASELQELGAAIVTLTGGEPLLRDDLEKIAAAFDDRTSLNLGTTGWGLTPARAAAIRESGVFSMGVSLDSDNEAAHDAGRGKPGAFRAALSALKIASAAGLYPYVVSLATREFLEPERFHAFLEFARSEGALEVHLLEPSATGKLAGRSDVLLGADDRRRMLEYQKEMARHEDMPIVSSFTYLESADAFGCGAGLTHLYIDGSGEVCPCNLVPLSFGNIVREPLDRILTRMGEHFREPRTGCVGRILNRHVPEGALPTPPDVSAALCRKHLPSRHELPRFFKLRAAASDAVGHGELRDAYDSVHGDYDEFWLKEAARPTDELVARLDLSGRERLFEAGCGTGYGTSIISRRLSAGGSIRAVDLSEGMLAEARRRCAGRDNITFAAGDALDMLGTGGAYDVVFSSWVLGYIPLAPFFAAAELALSRGGRLAFVVHKENSPREPLEIFAQLVAEDPSVLTKRVAFDFPRDAEDVKARLERARLSIEDLREGAIIFRYASPEAVLEHLLKSGAGTAFHDAVAPAKRAPLERRFLEVLAARHNHSGAYEVVHEYVACIAKKP